jgi:hypothetical protein
VAELHEYEVQHRGHTTTMQLSEDDAKLFPGAKKLGKVEQATPQPVTQPPYATEVPAAGEAEHEDDGEHLVTSKRAAPPQNKRR